MRKFRPIIVGIMILGFFVIYQNCGKKSDSTSSPTGQDSARDYYILDDNFTCTISGGKTVHTYKDRIELTSTDIIFMGNGCNDALVSKSRNDVVFQLSADQSSLTYNGATYQYLATPPSF